MQWALVGKAGQRIPVVVQRDGQRVKLVVTPSAEGAVQNRGLDRHRPQPRPSAGRGSRREARPSARRVQMLDRVLSVNGGR
jgi:hypothetical protein